MNTTDPAYGAEQEALLAGQPLDRDDTALLTAIKACYEAADPVPDGLVERLQFEITLDALHADLATLTQLDLSTAGARSTTEEVRTITFTSESLTTMVTVTPEGDGVRIDGWAVPGAGITVELLRTGGPLVTQADQDGRFVFEAVPSGLARFALQVTSGAEVSTVLSPTIEL